MSNRACDNCAVDDDEMIMVRRKYVTPETWDTPRSERTEAEPEMWCYSCASQYPHEVVELPDGEDGGAL